MKGGREGGRTRRLKNDRRNKRIRKGDILYTKTSLPPSLPQLLPRRGRKGGREGGWACTFFKASISLSIAARMGAIPPPVARRERGKGGREEGRGRPNFTEGESEGGREGGRAG